MNLDNLNKCLEILKLELTSNIKSTDKLQKVYQTRLSFLISDTESLIRIIEDPSRFEHLNKLCNPDKK